MASGGGAPQATVAAGGGRQRRVASGGVGPWRAHRDGGPWKAAAAGSTGGQRRWSAACGRNPNTCAFQLCLFSCHPNNLNLSRVVVFLLSWQVSFAVCVLSGMHFVLRSPYTTKSCVLFWREATLSREKRFCEHANLSQKPWTIDGVRKPVLILRGSQN